MWTGSHFLMFHDQSIFNQFFNPRFLAVIWTLVVCSMLDILFDFVRNGSKIRILNDATNWSACSELI